MSNYNGMNSMKAPIDFINEHYVRATKAQVLVVWLGLLVCVALAPWYNTWLEVILIGLPAALVPTAMSRMMPASSLTRISVGLSYMILSALMIHQGHGMIELHFAIFGYLAFLLYFRDWKPVVAAAGLIAVHHLTFNFLQAGGFNVWVFASGTGLDLVLIHAAFVVFETSVLVYMSVLLHREAVENAEVKTVGQYLSSSDGEIHLDMDFSDIETDFGKRLENYFETLREAIGKVRETSQVVAQSTREISDGNTSLAQRTEEQANSLRQIANNISDLNEAVRHNTGYTIKVDNLAGEATRDSLEGVSVVSRAVSAMSEISESSNKIGEIITSIDDIAFQTNLLAINASIEAAHAGEMGRGFAVVAEEVRALAKRCAEAAQETKELIEDSLVKVERGNELVGAAGATLGNINKSVEKLSGLVSQIATEGKKQQHGLEQVDTSIQQMNELTQMNTALVEEVAAASSTMDAEAQALNSTVDSFRLESTSQKRKPTSVHGSDRERHSPTLSLVPQHG